MKSKHILLGLLVVLILAISGGAFWWFEYRPQALRKSCYYENGINSGMDTRWVDRVMEICEREKGLR
jgi:hypothetical protein